MTAGYSSPTPVVRVAGPTQATAPQKTLDESALKERLTINSPALVKEIYDTTLRQIQAELGRQTRLDAKATSLLTAAGLSLTVAFTFGGQVIVGHPEAFRDAEGAAPLIALGTAIALGLSAAVYAIMALRVREYKGVNEDAVFNKELLTEADEADNSEEFPDAGITEYRKALTVHLWLISQEQGANHERKAKLIKFGQGFFLAFLVALFFVCAGVVAAVSSSTHGRSEKTSSEATEERSSTGKHQ